MVDRPTSRRCGKPSCEAPAAASLSFRYATGEVWLFDLAEPHPSRYDLCRPHAEQLTVPRGWQRVDERTAPVEPIVPAPPAADEEWPPLAVGGDPRGAAAGGVGGATTHRGGSRYAELSAQLPRLAAEVAADADSADASDEVDDPDDRRRGVPWGERAPIASRDLTPMPPDAPGGVVLAFERPGSPERDRTGEEHPDDEPDDPDDPGPVPS